jgi:hypothetical protein
VTPTALQLTGLQRRLKAGADSGKGTASSFRGGGDSSMVWSVPTCQASSGRN